MGVEVAPTGTILCTMHLAAKNMNYTAIQPAVHAKPGEHHQDVPYNVSIYLFNKALQGL